VNIPPFPDKKYHIILADPPWQYNDKKKAGRTKSGAENHYPCMSVDEIGSLNIPRLAEPNSVLFLWTTPPMIREALQVMYYWRFEYKTFAFDWTKLNKDGSVWFGVGAYAKSNNEVCLLGTRGNVGRLIKDDDGNRIVTDPKDKLSVISNNVSSNVQAVRGRHSAKPPIVRERIVQLFGDISRIELFARERVPGWDAWGLEVS